MTLRGYCEQMGLRLERSVEPHAPDMRTEHVRIVDFELVIHNTVVEAEARGATRADADAALVRLIVGRILRSRVRPTTLYWVPHLMR